MTGRDVEEAMADNGPSTNVTFTLLPNRTNFLKYAFKNFTGYDRLGTPTVPHLTGRVLTASPGEIISIFSLRMIIVTQYNSSRRSS